MPTSTSPDIPLTYTVPSFPSLYWPINTPSGAAQYLYYQSDIWRFTLYWTLIAYGAVHLATGGWAVVVLVRQVFLGTESYGPPRPKGVAGYVQSVKRVGEALGVGYGDRRVQSTSIELTERHGSNSVGTERGVKPQQQRTTRSQSHERVRPSGPSPSTTTTSTPRTSTQDPPPSGIQTQRQNQKKKKKKKKQKAPLARGSTRSKARDLRWVWLIPLVYCTIGSIEALMAGSIVGLILGAIYEAGYFKMSTWTPLVWSLVNVLLLILSSFSIQGGL